MPVNRYDSKMPSRPESIPSAPNANSVEIRPNDLQALLRRLLSVDIVPSQVPLLEAMTIINLDDIELLGSTTTSFLAVTFSLIVSIARPLLQTGTIPPHGCFLPSS